MSSVNHGPNNSPIMYARDSGSGLADFVTTTGNKLDVNASAAASTSASLWSGQQTVNTSQVQVSSSSHSLTNGIIIKALSANAATIYVGLTGVTTTTGDAIEPGEARGYAVNNTNLLYIISVASTTDKITFSAN